MERLPTSQKNNVFYGFNVFCYRCFAQLPEVRSRRVTNVRKIHFQAFEQASGGNLPATTRKLIKIFQSFVVIVTTVLKGLIFRSFKTRNK